MFCGETSIVSTSHFGQVASPVKCKRWGCPNCNDWRTKCLQARCIEGKPNRFITITCRAGQFGSPEANAQAISKAWATVVLRWRRLNKWHRCEYICVFEPHLSGWPHLHILWRGHWIERAWLSTNMASLLNSPIVHVSKIKGAKSAAFYVAKYFSKEPEKFGKSKRYWTSRNWPKLSHIDAQRAYHKGFPTDIVQQSIANIIAEWKRYSKEVWHQAPNKWGWGVLWEPPRDRPKKRETLLPWRDHWPRMPLPRPGSPMASRRGQRA